MAEMFSRRAVSGAALASAVTAFTSHFYDVTDAGAKNAGQDVDNAPLLVSAMRNALRQGEQVAYLPMGTYRIRSTMNPTDQTSAGSPVGKVVHGFSWFGGWGKIENPGLDGGYPYGSAAYYGAPELVWEGPRGGAMVVLDSMIGCAFLGMGLRGRATPKAISGAGVGVSVAQFNRGRPGSGGHLFERVNFNWLDVGVRFGDGQQGGGGNCDTTTFRDVSFQGCRVAVLTTHQQNLVFNFEGTCSFVDVRTVFRSQAGANGAGGYFNIQDLNAAKCGGTGPDDWMLDLRGGRNVGTHKVSRARLEAGCKQFARLQGPFTELLVEGLTETQDNQRRTMFEVRGADLSLIGGRLTTFDPSGEAPTFRVGRDPASGSHGSVSLYRTKLDASSFDFASWFGSTDRVSMPRISLRECELTDGTRIPSFSTQLEDGLPVPLRATTSGKQNVSATLRNDGDTSVYGNTCTIAKGAHSVRLVVTAVSRSKRDLLLRGTRDLDITYEGNTVRLLAAQRVGRDYNPDGLRFRVRPDSGHQSLEVVCMGKAGTDIDWTADLVLQGGTT